MSLETLFYPKNVALIGASKDNGSVGNEIAKNLTTFGYRGKLYFVNPKGGRLFGHKLQVNLNKIKKPLDLAVIAIPAPLVVDEVKLLLTLGTKTIVVISAGFREAGNLKAEEKLAKICRTNNVTLIGPNCLGILNPDSNLNASFAPLMPKKGTVAFISQSGALCASVLDIAQHRQIGFSKFVSTGNKALVGEVELLEYLYMDPKTKVIAIYMEELEEVNLLKKIAEKVTRGKVHKPIVVLKAGTTKAGKKAALSHTGSLGGSDEAYDALFSQSGIIRAQTIEELFDIIECFARNEPLKNDNVAVITNAGGPGVITADALVKNGLKLAKLADYTVEKLQKFLPKAANVNNPIDVLGDADATRYKKTLELILADNGVNAVEVIITPQSTTEVKKTAQSIVALKKQSPKPIIASLIGQNLVEEGLNILNESKVATSNFPDAAANALAALNIFRKWQITKLQKPVRVKDVNSKIVRQVLNANAQDTQKLLSADDVYFILNAYKFPTLTRYVVKTEEEANNLKRILHGPLALKIISPDINHKIDVGGVVLNVNPQDLKTQYKNLISHIKKVLPKAKIDGVEITNEVADEGLELIIGAKTDEKLGKQILVGLGGTYAEVIKDLSWGLAPLTRQDIKRMIARLRISKILSGYRGLEELSTNKLVECLMRLSQLVCDFPQIAQVDINPLKVLPKKNGAYILDARIVLLGANI